MHPETEVGTNQLLITLDADGRVIVSGPVDNKILCYGLLEAARQVIQEYKAEKLIVIPKHNGGRIDG